ncbi:MAG: choice-of-anchor tandem repeat GloVer-containing protein, partial [Candidatus Sulfotelmatobacter sp.]
MTQLNGWKTACIVLAFCAATANLSPAQTFTTLDASIPGSSRPQSPLVQSIDGNLYGEANSIFKVTPSGTATLVNGKCDTLGCVGGLVQNPNQDLYGTSSSGGTFNCGAFFEMTPNGTVFVMHDFACGYDGSSPRGGLAEASSGNFYGTTLEGGGFGYGTVFEATPSGTVTTLAEFHGPDGESPYSGVALGVDGNLYGTTALGGANGYGTFFKITPAGVLTVLHDFEGIDGANPQANLVEASNGNFYGTTTYGGVN